MVIKIDQLDKRKTYVVLEYGRGIISKEIDRLTKDYCKDAERRPSHILCLSYEKGCWMVYESHLKAVKKYGLPSGVRTYPYSTFEKAFPQIINETGKVYQLRIRVATLKEYLGQPYGTGDIAELMLAAKNSRKKEYGKQKDHKGLICSEYLAYAFAKIRKMFKLRAHCITPAHFLRYIQITNTPEIIFN